jgi:hypothetical protein
MCLINPNDTPKTLAMERFREGMADRKFGRDITTEKLIDLSKQLELPAQSITIIEL